MTGHLAGGIGAAAGAAVLYGSAPVAQAVASRRTPGRGVGLALVLRLLRQPIWLLGLGLEISGFLLEALAFSISPVTLVAPVVACDMLVFVLLGSMVFGTQLSRTGRYGAGAMVGAVILLTLAFSSNATLGRPADNAELIAFLLGCAVVAGAASLLGTRALAAERRLAAAAVFSTAAGIAYGLATMSTRQVGRTFSIHHPWNLLTTVTPYVLAGCSILGISLAQRALQTNPITAFPLISAVAAFLPVILGASLLGDQIPAGGLRALFIGALALLAAGVALLAGDRSVAEVATHN